VGSSGQWLKTADICCVHAETYLGQVYARQRSPEGSGVIALHDFAAMPCTVVLRVRHETEGTELFDLLQLRPAGPTTVTLPPLSTSVAAAGRGMRQ
jgi:hypothetical protein